MVHFHKAIEPVSGPTAPPIALSPEELPRRCFSGTGGEAVEYLCEWDLPLNKVLYKAFDLNMHRR